MNPQNLPSREIRIARCAAICLDLPDRCHARACRRGGRCNTSICGAEEPPCAALLRKSDRACFEALCSLAARSLPLALARQEPPPAPGDPLVVFFRESAMLIACAVLLDEESLEPAHLRWLWRRRRLALERRLSWEALQFLRFFGRPPR